MYPAINYRKVNSTAIVRTTTEFDEILVLSMMGQKRR